MEEQGLAFSSGRAKEEENRRADRRLREEQDAAYLAALHIDQVHVCMMLFRMSCFGLQQLCFGLQQPIINNF